ncbi:MAG: hypothetical protein FE78DRAFT_152252 [Acidomyces sp. 'richmondensis']|nr:MAG: hypothetical protein FE78DRAFT_152252 [Acidomyces sp. 'richmondensis']
MADAFQTRTMKRKNVKGLALQAPARPAAPSIEDAQLPGSIANANSSRTDTLEIGVEFRPDWRSEDLELLKDLGAGNGGSVSKVRHTGLNIVMAQKVIHVEAKKEVRRRIVRELQIMHECNSPYIVTFYGAFMNESGDVTMCMEYMDCGSLDAISKNFGPIRVDVLGKIAEAILGGLKYLYLAHRIMHRDIKPSNVLVNSKGQIKLSDFGVSAELENSVADTFVGTGTYMAPERIQGSPYTVKSDVWSVGLTLMELAIGKFPFSMSNDGDGEDDEEAAGPQGILDLLQQIVLEPSPKLPKSEAFPQILEDFIAKCLMKNPDERPTPQELYDADPFLQAAKRTPVDLAQWAVGMMEKHNRKSHLAPPLSPATRAALSRGDDNITWASSGTITAQPTPRTATQASYNTSQRTPVTAELPSIPNTNGSSVGPRPYPARTSSAQAMPQQGTQQMHLPIRQAPSSGRRPETSGSDRNDGNLRRAQARQGFVQ